MSLLEPTVKAANVKGSSMLHLATDILRRNREQLAEADKADADAIIAFCRKSDAASVDLTRGV